MLLLAALMPSTARAITLANGILSPGEVRSSSGRPGLYDVDAGNVDIKFVLEALARRSHSNIVVSPDVAGEITAHLTQQPLESILNYICMVRGIGWAKKENAYLVAPTDKLTPQVAPTAPIPPKVFVWECRHVLPSALTSSIQGIFPSIKVSEGPNAAMPVIANSTSGISGGSTQTSGVQSSTTPSTSTRIILVGDAAEVARAKDLLSQLDVPSRQVYIDVRITEINSSGSKDLGVVWSWNDLTVNESSAASGIAFGKFTKQGMSFTGTISALIANGQAKLLASPNITVIDGASANILIGDKILFPKLIGYSQAGTPIYDKDEEQVGISLQIAPKISDNDEIIMTLYPQVSLVTSYLKTQAGDYPQISTREAKTTVSVKSGSTLAIGGLIREDDVLNASKVPLLGDLPIIGHLFRQSKKTSQRNEIVILLTPRLLSDK